MQSVSGGQPSEQRMFLAPTVSVVSRPNDLTVISVTPPSIICGVKNWKETTSPSLITRPIFFCFSPICCSMYSPGINSPMTLDTIRMLLSDPLSTTPTACDSRPATSKPTLHSSSGSKVLGSSKSIANSVKYTEFRKPRLYVALYAT